MQRKKVVFTSFKLLNQNRYFTAGLFLIIPLSLSFKEVRSTFSATGLLNFLIIFLSLSFKEVRSTLSATGLHDFLIIFHYHPYKSPKYFLLLPDFFSHYYL